MIPDLISTIIPVHNRPAQLNQAVQSVLAQDYRPIEILIVDDGSDDRLTNLLAEQLRSQHQGLIRVLRRANGGPGLARESGRQAARGEFLQYLDSDDVLLPGKFTAQVQALHSCPDADVAYGITRFRDHRGVLHSEPLKGTGESIERMFPRFLNERWWETATPLYRRQVCDAAGPWTDLRLEEDWEYDCRIAALGGRLVWCAQPVSEHRDHSGSRLSREPRDADPKRLQDRARAWTLVHGHARRAGLAPTDPAMQRFARGLFLLARCCGAAGLSQASSSLWAQAFALTRDGGGRGRDLRLYGAIARRIGWHRAGRFSQWR